jgi:release factor glutamine methyltransferase
MELLRWTTDHFAAKGIESARLDAELLLAFALGVDRLRLYLAFEKPVVDEERARFRALVRRRGEERVPVAYLTGVREFWSLPLAVTPDVLIPRPDTETLIEAVLARWPGSHAAARGSASEADDPSRPAQRGEAERSRARGSASEADDPSRPAQRGEAERSRSWRVLDLGTGSGAIALALAKEWPEAQVTAADVSDAALAVARKNAEALGLAERLRFASGDLFAPVAGERFDVIVSNPPYVAEADALGLAPELRHEPALALFAPGDGTALLRRIAAEAPARLTPGGLLALELAPAQAGDVTQCLREAGFSELAEHRDLAGRVRAVSGLRGPGGE